ncbi:MAG: polysaccharide biosynthesis protein [Clostridium sp.]
MAQFTRLKSVIMMVIDIILINLAYVLSFYIRFDSMVPEIYYNSYKEHLPIIILLYIIPFIMMKMYKNRWGVAGIDEYLRATGCCFIGGALNFIIMFFMQLRIPNLVTITASIFIIILIMGYRVGIRVINRLYIYKNSIDTKGKSRTLIVGAGEGAQLAISEIKKNKGLKYNVIGLIDDDSDKVGTYILGKKVLGKITSIKKIIEKEDIDSVIIAIPSIQSDKKIELIKLCQDNGVVVKVMPSIEELLESDINNKKIRDVDLKDLLGREEVILDKKNIADYISNNVILVTGGGGSIGSELCRQIAKYSPKELIILDIYENNAYELQTELQRKLPNLNLKVIISSVRDKSKIYKIFKEYKPNVVFHAAAHKHVPLMEFNPAEAIKNNVVGTLNVAQAASDNGVDKFVLISTDKAVNPTNVMGATKRVCEMIVQAINAKSSTEFVAVRFGNVLGSNGSVIPLFKKQIEAGGPITLTHKDITRYFMLIPEAAQLVLQAGAFARGGEIFVLDMGKPVKIYDLAIDLIKLSGLEPHTDISIDIVGLRPGEKLYEELLMAENELSETQHDKIFIEMPANIDYEVLVQKIRNLELVSLKEDKNIIKDELHKIVPTYSNGLNEVATTSES